MDGWSGALVCPDAAGHYYAVGVFHSHRGNCELGTEKAPTRYWGVFVFSWALYLKRTKKKKCCTLGFGTVNRVEMQSMILVVVN